MEEKVRGKNLEEKQVGTKSGEERQGEGKKTKKYGLEDKVWQKIFGSSEKQKYMVEKEEGCTLQTIFHICIPKKDLVKPDF